MKTITFYSYKGGVGRTLLLANVAKYLCKFGQKVFALDFDLEAPGLHYKLTPPESWKSLAGRPGVVDYVYSFVAESGRPESLRDYVMEVGRHDEVGGVVHMMRAGDVPTADYWRKLAGINWHEIFYSEGSRGIPIFLDLKARIEEEYQADYLLIDSRTGITEIGGVATTVLPDMIVCLILNNPENLEGAREVLRSIGRTRRQRSQTAVEILPAVSRLPASDEATEAGVVDSVRDALNQEAPLMEDTLALEQMLVLHREPSLESRESLLIDGGIDTPLFRDYLGLIARLVPPAVLAPHIIPLVQRAMDRASDDPGKTEQDLVALCEHASIPEPHQALIEFYIATRAPKSKLLQSALRWWRMTGRGDDPILLKALHESFASGEAGLPEVPLEFIQAVWTGNGANDSAVGLQLARVALNEKRPQVAADAIARAVEARPEMQAAEIVECLDLASRSDCRPVMMRLIADHSTTLSANAQVGHDFRRAWVQAAKKLGPPYSKQFLGSNLSRFPVDVAEFVDIYELAEREGEPLGGVSGFLLNQLALESVIGTEQFGPSEARFVEIIETSGLGPALVEVLGRKAGSDMAEDAWNRFRRLSRRPHAR